METAETQICPYLLTTISYLHGSPLQISTKTEKEILFGIIPNVIQIQTEQKQI